MKKFFTPVVSIAIILLALPFLSASAGGKSFPKIVPALEGAPPEGFAIGKGHTAYNGSIDGSIFKMNLRNGQGEILVAAEPDFDVFAGDCYKLGMRVDPRSNHLFVAGCINGDAYVIDADTGEELMHYQLGPEGEFALPNDLAITKRAVYFTDSQLPLLYRLPLSKNGKLPSADAITTIQLPDEFILDPENDPCCGGNGIVATPDGKTLIVGHSNLSRLYRVDPATGGVDEIEVNPPLSGFLDGIVLYDGILFILTPDDSGAYPPVDRIQVVALDDDMLTGTLVGTITDPDMDGVASGAMHGDSLYVNNARYFDFPGPPTEYWITKLNIYDVE
jgi:sugar lactone lactonase YvrE